MELNINEMIKKSGMKKEYIAKKMGISRVTLTNYISGRTPITLVKAVELAGILNCEVTDLIKKATPKDGS